MKESPYNLWASTPKYQMSAMIRMICAAVLRLAIKLSGSILTVAP